MSLEYNRTYRRGELYKEVYPSENHRLTIGYNALVDGKIFGPVPGESFDSTPFIVTEVSDGEEANVTQIISNKPFGKLYSFGDNYISLSCSGMIKMTEIPSDIDKLFISYLFDKSFILNIRINNQIFYGWCINQLYSFLTQPQEHCGFKLDFLCLEANHVS